MKGRAGTLFFLLAAACTIFVYWHWGTIPRGGVSVAIELYAVLLRVELGPRASRKGISLLKRS